MSATITPIEPPSPEVAIPGASSETVMQFSQHLSELRTRIVTCVTVLGVTVGVAFWQSPAIIRLLKAMAPTSTLFVQLTPGEVFLSSFKLSMMVGLGVALPVFLYHTIRFVVPGMKSTETRVALPLLLLAPCLFSAGILFGYYAVLPFMLAFLLDYGSEVAQNQLSIAAFLDFCTGFLVATGLMFELPLFLLLTGLLGLINSQQLASWWKGALVVAFFVGAVVTPSADPFSQTMMAVCLFALYGVSLVLLKLFKR